MSMKAGNYQGFSALFMNSDTVSCVVIPELGGKIVELVDRRTSRNWLWENDQLSLQKPRAGASYTAEFDSGGWDELLPTIEPCCCEESVWGKRQLTDHGELWCRSWQVVSATASNEHVKLTLLVDDADLPIRLQRTIALNQGTASLTISYELVNRTSQDVPYIWAAHPLLSIAPGYRVEVPPGTRAVFLSGFGEPLPEPFHEFIWPNATSSQGPQLDYSSIPNKKSLLWGTGSKIFLMLSGEASITISDPTCGDWFRLFLDDKHIPYVGLWMNYGSWSGTGGNAYYNLGIEPTSVTGDSLADAILRGDASLVPAGSQETWSFKIVLNQGGTSS